jgi:hypothetical protein
MRRNAGEKRGRGGLKQREEDGELESVKNGGKGEMFFLKKNGRKCKQMELKTGLEVNEVDVSEVVGVVKFSDA